MHLIKLADYTNYLLELRELRKENKEFAERNLGIKLPPNYLMYESFQLNYKKYYEDSILTANWLINHLKPYVTFENIRILDWGCGPARIVRHLPIIIGSKAEIYGTDYNKRSIEWCKKNIDGVQFNHNQLGPPLPYENNFFDTIYGISIFTHLSEEMHYKWIDELFRILKPGGVLFLTLHGKAFRIKLTNEERDEFDKGKIVIKANTKEGHRTFGAYHPISFVNDMIKKNIILSHIEGEIRNGKPQQDIWIIKKKN